MIFYKAEKAVAGLVEKMQANSSIAYTTQLQPWTPDEKGIDHGVSFAKRMIGDAKASISDDDLFYTKSVLVSTNWNKNDDVFGPEEVWAARNTPSHKPTNLEHDEKRLVGHITDVWALDDEGEVIPDNTPVDELPDLYHLVNGAVIYTSWQDQKLVDRTAALIQEIQSGKKFVSMEALFSGFDYSIITPDNDFRVLARNKSTAFLTKHLRAYGGKGEYEGCKVGRLLKSITFSGKGYVDNPANERSIILNSSSVFDFGKASIKNPFNEESGVSYSCANNNNSLDKGQTNMAETSNDMSQRQIEKLEKAVSELQSKNDELQAKANEAGIKGLNDRIESLEAELAEAKTGLDEAQAKIDEADKAKAELETKLEEVTAAKKSAEDKIAEAEAAKAKADRVATLVSGGVSKEDAEAKVELFESLSDEQFEAVASEVVAAKKAQQSESQTSDSDEESTEASAEESDEDDASQDSAEANADESVIDNAQTTDEPTLSTASEDKKDKTEATRRELQRVVGSFLSLGDDDSDEDDAVDSN